MLEGRDFSRDLDVQKVLTHSLLPHRRTSDLCSLLHTRWVSLFKDLEIDSHILLDEAKFASDHFCRIVKGFKPAVCFSVLKWWTYSLCTAARFQKPDEQCPICGLAGSDNIFHISCCGWLDGWMVG